MTTPHPESGPSSTTPTGQYPPAGQHPPSGRYPSTGQYGPGGQQAPTGPYAPALQAGPGQVPPGWYPGPFGAPQWWDGRGWGPTAPPAADNSNTMAMFCYLGMLFVGFLVPLIILLTEGGKSRFVKHHATEALNWAITAFIVTIPLVVLYFVAFVAAFGGFATGSGGGAAAGVGVAVVLFIVVIVALLAMGVLSLVWTIMGAVKANQRRWFRYPIAIRLVKGALSKQEADALNRGVV